MFEELMTRVRRAQAEFEFELARTTDPYRLEQLCNSHAVKMASFKWDAGDMVKELEEN